MSLLCIFLIVLLLLLIVLNIFLPIDENILNDNQHTDHTESLNKYAEHAQKNLRWCDMKKEADQKDRLA